MFKSTKQKAAGSRVRLIGIILIVVISVAAWLICQFAVGSEKLGFAPILLLFTIGFLGAGILYLAYAAMQKDAVMSLFGGVSLSIGSIFLMAIFSLPWYVVLIVALVLLFVSALLPWIIRAPKLVVEVDNDPEAAHKTYDERKAEEAEKEALTPKQEEALPEIKSFKD